MPMNYPVTELWTPENVRRCVFSQEEYEEALSNGCTEDRPAVVDSTPELMAEEPVKRGPGRPRKQAEPEV